MNTLDKLNKLNKSDFVSIFGNVFEKTTWIAEKVFNLRPFKTYDELSNKFQKLGASFITLNFNGKLRGCIGSIQAWQPLIDDIIENLL